MENLISKKNSKTITSLELLEQINFFRKKEGNKSVLRHDTLLNIIRDEFEEEIGLQKILETPYIHPQNKQKYPMYTLTLNQAKQVLIRESKAVRKAVIQYIEKLEKELKNSFDFETLTEDEKRLYLRHNIKEQNKILFDTAKNCGVTNYGKFNNYGYQGLYGGETAKDIKRRKGIDENKDILDFMYSTEAAANLFRITQTDERLKRGDITTEEKANTKHYEIGAKVRQTMIDISGIAPEKLPTPEKSVKEIEQQKKKQLKLDSKTKKLK